MRVFPGHFFNFMPGFIRWIIIYQDDFIEVWQKGYLPYRDRTWMKTGPCADCRYFKWCRGNGMHLRDGGGQLLACRLREMSLAQGLRP